ncbi:FAD-binding protein [Escherichia coli]|nr:FAD-binding protein [Escherichia coli]
MMKLPVREFDAVVIGAGGAGMRAALQISQSGQTCALLSKSLPDPFPYRFCARRHYRCAG